MQIKHSDMSYLVSNQEKKFPYLLKVTETNIKNVWFILERYVEINLQYGVHTETKQGVYDLLLSGHSQLWLKKRLGFALLKNLALSQIQDAQTTD